MAAGAPIPACQEAKYPCEGSDKSLRCFSKQTPPAKTIMAEVGRARICAISARSRARLSSNVGSAWPVQDSYDVVLLTAVLVWILLCNFRRKFGKRYCR